MRPIAPPETAELAEIFDEVCYELGPSLSRDVQDRLALHLLETHDTGTTDRDELKLSVLRAAREIIGLRTAEGQVVPRTVRARSWLLISIRPRARLPSRWCHRRDRSSP